MATWADAFKQMMSTPMGQEYYYNSDVGKAWQAAMTERGFNPFGRDPVNQWLAQRGAYAIPQMMLRQVMDWGQMMSPENIRTFTNEYIGSGTRPGAGGVDADWGTIRNLLSQVADMTARYNRGDYTGMSDEQMALAEYLSNPDNANDFYGALLSRFMGPLASFYAKSLTNRLGQYQFAPPGGFQPGQQTPWASYLWSSRNWGY
jgi:hypothetical protein